jgi:hypothetical protein
MSTTSNLSLPIYGPNHPDASHDVGVIVNGAMAILDNAATVVAVPGSATAAGKPNQIAYDATHIYVCVATNTWVRATLATF